MTEIKVSLIVAMANNRVIGLDGGLPWHISGDLKFFKRVTMGHPIIMGRKTYQSIGGALPGRANIIITRNKDFQAPDADVVHGLDEALEKAKAIAHIDSADAVFVIGGADIYAQALAQADRIYLTEVAGDFPGDAYFPDLPEGNWQETSRESHPAAGDDPAYSFVILDQNG